MDLSGPDPSFSDSSISDDMTGSSDNKANDVTANVFASSRKRSALGLVCVKVAGVVMESIMFQVQRRKRLVGIQ